MVVIMMVDSCSWAIAAQQRDGSLNIPLLLIHYLISFQMKRPCSRMQFQFLKKYQILLLIPLNMAQDTVIKPHLIGFD